MSNSGERTAAVSGANGYLGGVICDRLRKEGWQTLKLLRSGGGESCRRFVLGAPVEPDLFEGVDLLVHCAYDMALRRAEDIWRINVAGTEKLLEVGRAAGIGRMIVLSSMSAFDVSI
jgi:nucleoside-diphosphate-sugar epimerase